MPWKEHRVMSLRIEFVERASLPGANIAALCREFEVSRPTAYKWIKRFKERGYDGLEELSRRPASAPLATAEDVVVAVVEARVKHPRWGAKKLVNVLRRELGENTPSESTIERILRRAGQLRMRRKRRPLSVVDRAPQVTAVTPNDVWTIDFKGWWRVGDGERCEPLTIRDAASRFVLAVALLKSCNGECVRAVMEKLFRRHGVPKAIQCDNGSPFITMRGRAGLTTLSTWWVALGIKLVRSRPGHPEDNGAHERMHADLAADVQVEPEATLVAQQRACDRWRQTFNHVRPHEALGGKTPAEVYRSSPAKPVIRPWRYPGAFVTRRVSGSGTVKIHGEHYSISRALTGYYVGLEHLGGLRHRIWFYELDLGEIEIAEVSDRHVLPAA